jgi:CRP/FNR family transcriptional regulator, cyclic AMP receptor protein
MSNSVDGKKIVLNFLGPGDTTGEIAVLDGKQRTADVIALEKSEVFLVYSRDLPPLLIAHPQALLEVVQVLCEKHRAASAIIDDKFARCATPHGERSIAARVATWRNQQRRCACRAEGVTSELGGYLGLSRENVNRQLSQLRLANVLRNAGTHFIVTDEAALCEIAEMTWMEP